MILLKLLCSERSKNTSQIISLSIDGNVRISDALKKSLSISRDKYHKYGTFKRQIYTNGYTCYNKAFQEIKELVEDAEK